MFFRCRQRPGTCCPLAPLYSAPFYGLPIEPTRTRSQRGGPAARNPLVGLGWVGGRSSGYLKAVWPGFLGVRFRGLVGPGGPEKLMPPTFWKAFPGPRGRPDLKNAPT